MTNQVKLTAAQTKAIAELAAKGGVAKDVGRCGRVSFFGSPNGCHADGTARAYQPARATMQKLLDLGLVARTSHANSFGGVDHVLTLTDAGKAFA